MNVLKHCRYGMMIFNVKDIWVGRALDLYGEAAESEVQVFRDIIKPHFLVIDAGAYVGTHTVALARLANQGLVLAFEPERVAYYALCGNVSVNNLRNVRCFQQLLGKENATVNVPELDAERTTNWGGLTFTTTYNDGYPGSMITVDSMNLDRLDFMKIDVEGMEQDVLEGANATIMKHKPALYLESDQGERGEKLVLHLRELGYVIYQHLAPLFNPGNFNEVRENVFVHTGEKEPVPFVSGNLFCHHKDKGCPLNPERFAMKKVGE